MAVALFLAALLAANAAAAHNGSHPAPAAASAARALGNTTEVGAAFLTAVPAPARPDDPGCAHSSLHVFCAAAPSCCMEAADQAVDPMAYSIRVTGRWRHAPVAGLAPPPLDRPPR